jgi:3',5'-cyclic AMP phosphodiesterase CpdA
MSSLLQLSDTHFGTEVADVVEALERLVSDLRPDALLLSGDITQRATRAQFRAARRFIERLQVPRVLVLPGNHDLPLFDLISRAFFPYRRFEQEQGVSAAGGVDDLPGLRLVRVKSTRRSRHIDGEVSARQIEAVADALRGAPAHCLRLVATHQPLWVDRPCDAHNACHGAAPALQAWREAGADLLLAGHIHWPFVRCLEGSRPMWAINAGTAVSARVRDGMPQSCNLLRWDTNQPRAGCELARYDYWPAAAGFVQGTNRSLAFD